MKKTRARCHRCDKAVTIEETGFLDRAGRCWCDGCDLAAENASMNEALAKAYDYLANQKGW